MSSFDFADRESQCRKLKLRPAFWIGVGTNDLFHEEDVTYARRLQEAGVRCSLKVVPGAYHGFDRIELYASVSRSFAETQIRALADAFGVDR